MDLDRQSIEKRDFPVSRRGYDPAAVDAHLRVLSSEVEELRRTAAGRGADSLAATAGTQVQSIIAAAEAAAAEIESQAQSSANSMREEATRDAEKTRADAVARAQAHVQTVSEATATLLARVESMDGEASKLVDSLRAGAGRLARDLTALETNMGELYDAASGRAAGGGVVRAVADEKAPVVAEPPRPADVPSPVAAPVPPPPLPEPASPFATSSPASSPAPASVPPMATENGDLDGARLVALNMALNGDSREQTDRYLAENYELPDRQKLLDEVYAAIEG